MNVAFYRVYWVERHIHTLLSQGRRRRSPAADDPPLVGSGQNPPMGSVPVNVDNFVRAESDRMFAAIQQQAGAVNRWQHNRVPTPVAQQTVIRMNRDTLYSAAVVDISAGAVITIPDAGRRYSHVVPARPGDPGTEGGRLRYRGDRRGRA
jgi:hypothetical protein